MEIISYQQMVDAIYQPDIAEVEQSEELVADLSARPRLSLRAIKNIKSLRELAGATRKRIELDHFRDSVEDTWQPTVCGCGRLIGHGCSR